MGGSPPGWFCSRRRLTRFAACLSCLAFWMQTTGTSLLAAKRRSLVHVQMAVQDSCSAHGLLYLAAVSGDWPVLCRLHQATSLVPLNRRQPDTICLVREKQMNYA